MQRARCKQRPAPAGGTIQGLPWVISTACVQFMFGKTSTPLTLTYVSIPMCTMFSCVLRTFIIGSIARSASRRYFEVFRPTGHRSDTLHRWGEIWHWHVALALARWTDGMKFGIENGTFSMPNFNSIGAKTRGVGPQNWNFYSDLTKMWNINAPHGRIPCAIFTKFAVFVPILGCVSC